MYFYIVPYRAVNTLTLWDAHAPEGNEHLLCSIFTTLRACGAWLHRMITPRRSHMPINLKSSTDQTRRSRGMGEFDNREIKRAHAGETSWGELNWHRITEESPLTEAGGHQTRQSRRIVAIQFKVHWGGIHVLEPRLSLREVSVNTSIPAKILSHLTFENLFLRALGLGGTTCTTG